MANFDPPVLAAFAFLCLSGLASNFAAFYYTVKVLGKVQRSLFILLITDSVTSLAGISVFLTLSGFIYLDIFDETLCSILFVSLHTPSIVGIVSTATIAIFRYTSLVQAAKNRPLNDRKLTAVNLVIIASLFGVVGFVAVFHLKTGLPLSIISEACFNGDQPRPLRPLTKLYGIAPLVAFLLISLVFDYLILRFVRVTVLPSLRQSDLGSRVNGVSEGMTHFRTVDTSYEAIPIRATLLSALTLVPYLLIGLTVSLYSNALGPSTCATIIGVIALILNAIRFPTASLLTFAGQEPDSKPERRAEPEVAAQRKMTIIISGQQVEERTPEPRYP